jgi:hypothetical protein
VKQAAVGSQMTMDCAYIDRAANQAICCWDAPDRPSVEALFAKAGIKPESFREVTVYPG